MTKKEIISLLNLLEDPDEKVYNEIKRKILESNKLFRTVIDEYWSTVEDVLTLERLEEISEVLRIDDTANALKNWKDTNDLDLISGILLIEELFDPLFDKKNIKNQIDNLYQKVWLEFNNQLTAIEKIKLLNHFLYSVEGFEYKKDTDIKPHHYGFSQLINHRKFSDKNFAILYTYIAQRLNLPVFILNRSLSGFSVLGYVDETLAVTVFAKTDNNIVFYVLPSFSGEIWSQNQIVSFAEEKNFEFEMNNIKAINNIDIARKWFNYRINLFSNDNIISIDQNKYSQILKILSD